MKCYHDRADSQTAAVQVSLGEALRLIREYNFSAQSSLGGVSLGYIAAADMLQASGPHSPVTVADGCVWVEDSVPVLEIDRVVSDWWRVTAARLLSFRPEKAHCCLIQCTTGYSEELRIKWTFSAGYQDETTGGQSEATLTEQMRRLGWQETNQPVTVTALLGKPEDIPY